MDIIILEGDKMTDVEQAHSYIAQTMRFPAYYGKNLDALADCLGELSPNNIIILVNAASMRARLGEYAEKLLSVFHDMSSAPDAFTFVAKD